MKRLLSFILAGLVAASFAVSAQLRRPEATITPFVDGVGAAGSSIRLGLKVALPEDLHTQSNAPRDPTLIATKLTIDPVDGVTIKEIVWPPPTDFVVAGIDQPLAVFEHEFPIGVDVVLADSVARGNLTLTGRLKYQACDKSLCYAPTTTELSWPIPIGPVRVPATDVAVAAFFKALRFGAGSKPADDEAE